MQSSNDTRQCVIIAVNQVWSKVWHLLEVILASISHATYAVCSTVFASSQLNYAISNKVNMQHFRHTQYIHSRYATQNMPRVLKRT